MAGVSPYHLIVTNHLGEVVGEEVGEADSQPSLDTFCMVIDAVKEAIEQLSPHDHLTVAVRIQPPNVS